MRVRNNLGLHYALRLSLKIPSQKMSNRYAIAVSYFTEIITLHFKIDWNAIENQLNVFQVVTNNYVRNKITT